MKKLSPIPEDCEFEAAALESGRSEDLRVLMDELKEAVGSPRPAEREFEAAVKAFTRVAEALGSANGSEGIGSRLRLGVFLDTANLTDRDPEDPIRVDFGKLLQHVAADRRLVHARAYCPIYSDFSGRLEHQRSVAPVWDKGYDIVTKPIKVFADGTRKADLDLVLVIDVIRRLPTMDVVALMSGDGDYVPMVEYLREHGLRVEVYSFADAISEDLRVAADEWFDISAMRAMHLNSSSGAGSRRRSAVTAEAKGG